MEFLTYSTYKNLRINKYILVFSVLLLFAYIQATQATTNKKVVSQIVFTKNNYAVLISQPNHLKAAVNTAETLSKTSKYNSDNFVVMACGKSVEAFVKSSDQNEQIETGKKAGITYKICGMSLKQFNIHPDSLVDGVDIVPNGLTYMFDVQSNGYKTVEL
ncbi:DsrE family protein [Cytophaga aurantiaca]|uniref:DsrE family protein n=1 Tax=Cytophaga aurantiaca TaxID=29530 RepID=UPI00035D7A69|nr:DsrE family protein [Cytophaga aurantiaca]